MAKDIVPVLLLTGYLGSGKTTLLNRILSNSDGIRFAVIVNDLGEVNIDASLVKKGGIVGQTSDSSDLVALQNGCICCTLKMDLIEQLSGLASSGDFDYIVIEASGICEPAPIAQTICAIPALEARYSGRPLPSIDCICTVVDALRLRDEFESGERLTGIHRGEDDIESLIIDQIEFCNLILLNKVSEVSPEDAGRIRTILRAIQPQAQIIECDYCDVSLSAILNTGLFSFERTATSAAWVRKLEHSDDEVDDYDDGHNESHVHHHHGEECHCGHCDGHHHHGEGEAAEYGIQTFVYYRRQPFDLTKFDRFVSKNWPRAVIRTKGVVYFKHDRDMSYLFEQAGTQKKLTRAGLWFATAPKEELKEMMLREPGLARDWDPEYGDRMVKLVVIGQNIDRCEIERELDACLV